MCLLTTWKTWNRSGKVPKYVEKRPWTWNRLAFLHCSRWKMFSHNNVSYGTLTTQMYHLTNTSQITPLTSAPRTRIISCVKLFSALANLKIQSAIAHCRNLPPNPAVTHTPIPQPRASIDWFKIPDHENTCVRGRESPNTCHQLGPLLHLTVEIETWDLIRMVLSRIWSSFFAMVLPDSMAGYSCPQQHLHYTYWQCCCPGLLSMYSLLCDCC